MSPLFHMLRLCVLCFSTTDAGESGSSHAEALKRCDKSPVASKSNEHGTASSGNLANSRHDLFRMRNPSVLSEHLSKVAEILGDTLWRLYRPALFPRTPCTRCVIPSEARNLGSREPSFPLRRDASFVGMTRLKHDAVYRWIDAPIQPSVSRIATWIVTARLSELDAQRRVANLALSSIQSRARLRLDCAWDQSRTPRGSA
jgi:hypothetical protein